LSPPSCSSARISNPLTKEKLGVGIIGTGWVSDEYIRFLGIVSIGQTLVILHDVVEDTDWTLERLTAARANPTCATCAAPRATL